MRNDYLFNTFIICAFSSGVKRYCNTFGPLKSWKMVFLSSTESLLPVETIAKIWYLVWRSGSKANEDFNSLVFERLATKNNTTKVARTITRTPFLWEDFIVLGRFTIQDSRFKKRFRFCNKTL